MTTKDKGNIAESIALSEFVKRNITVSIPFGDNAKYDLIADFNGKLNRIQVKYCGCKSNTNSYICVCESKKSHTNKKHHIYTKKEIDYIFFYIAEVDTSVLIPIEDINGKGEIYLREHKTSSNQRLINDYLIDKIINF